MFRTCALVFSALLLFGCSTPNSSRYTTSDVGRTIETSPGTVVASRVVRVSGSDSNVGPIAGGALGGAGAGWGLQSGWAAVIGAVIGAGAGYLAQDAMSGRDGIEYMVQMDDGRTVTLVQNREDEEQPIADGTPVLVQLGGKYSRVVPDPRGTSRPSSSGGGAAGGGWVDPDKVGSPPAAVPPARSPAPASAPPTQLQSSWRTPPNSRIQ